MPKKQENQRSLSIPAWGFAWIFLTSIIIGTFFWALLSGGSQVIPPTEVIISLISEDETEKQNLPSVLNAVEVPPMEKNRGFSQGTVENYRVGLILTNLGTEPELLAKAAAELPIAVDFAIRADTPHLQQVISDLRASGRELFLMVPMEPDGYPHNDPGPNPLLTSNSAEENLRRISEHTASAEGIIGLTPFMGQAFSRDTTSNEPIASWLSKSGYALLDFSNQQKRSQFVDSAREYGATYIDNPVILDSILTDTERKLAKFEYMETIAKREGISVGIIEADPDVITALNEWITSLPKKKIVLTPVSSVYLPDSENSEIYPVSTEAVVNSTETHQAAPADNDASEPSNASLTQNATHDKPESDVLATNETNAVVALDSKEPSDQTQTAPTPADKEDDKSDPTPKDKSPAVITEQMVKDSHSEANTAAEDSVTAPGPTVTPAAPAPPPTEPAGKKNPSNESTPDKSNPLKKTLPLKISQPS